MKKEIHPENYRYVVFQDPTAGESFITKSCVETEKTIEWEDGKTYPLYQVAISSYSHPFYTGSQKLVDSQGRIDKFNKRYKRK